MYSAYKLNKQGDNIQLWCSPFPIWNQSVVPCPVLTVAPWPAYRFLKRQVRWSGIPISFRIFHILLWCTQSVFGIINKAEINVFLELFCFLIDPADVCNLISGSSAFSKTSLNIWKLRGAIPRPRTGGYVGTGGLRGATPHSRSGGAAMRKYPSSKVRSSSCTLLEQPWRDTPRLR